MLLPARTDTKWFHEFIYQKAEVRFVRGRLKFGDSKNSAPFPSMVVIYKKKEGADNGKVKGKKKNKRPEYVVICREFNRDAGRIEISVIDSGVTDHLLDNLIKMHLRDPHKRYFLTLKKDYQVYGAVWKKQIETMSIKNNKRIVELGIELEKD